MDFDIWNGLLPIQKLEPLIDVFDRPSGGEIDQNLAGVVLESADRI